MARFFSFALISCQVVMAAVPIRPAATPRATTPRGLVPSRFIVSPLSGPRLRPRGRAAALRDGRAAVGRGHHRRGPARRLPRRPLLADAGCERVEVVLRLHPELAHVAPEVVHRGTPEEPEA